MHRQEYVAKAADRYEVKRPKDSDMFKAEGSFADQTLTHAEFAAKKGERFETKRPETSDIWKVSFSKTECFIVWHENRNF